MFRRMHGLMRSTARLLAIAATLGCFACANQSSYIDIDYRLPAAAKTLEGRTVYLETRDLRADPNIFNAAAREKFKAFTGLFSLSIETGTNQSTVLGAYRLPQLFEMAMKQRLNRLGIETVSRPDANTPTFQLKINRFRIQLIGQKWQADVSYEASLTQDTQLVAREVVTGSAERMKIMGTGGADKVLGDIFTDMINRLDVERLFAQAKL